MSDRSVELNSRLALKVVLELQRSTGDISINVTWQKSGRGSLWRGRRRFGAVYHQPLKRRGRIGLKEEFVKKACIPFEAFDDYDPDGYFGQDGVCRIDIPYDGKCWDQQKFARAIDLVTRVWRKL